MPFSHSNKNMNTSISLADRIRLILSDLDGPEYGKQARLAEIARCGRPVVNHWLTHKQESISSKHAMNIAHALGYRMEWVMNGSGPRRSSDADTGASKDEQVTAQEPTFVIHLSEEEMQLITAYRKADAMDRAVMRHLFLKKTDGAGNN